MELIKVLESFGLTVENIDEMSDEDLQKMIDEHVKEKDEHITKLEEEKNALSKTAEELTASVEGLKAEKEKADKELTETKGRLSQVTEMYKEQFSKPVEEQDTKVKPEKLTNDVMQMLIDAQ